jgi:hypothetical protein
MDINRYTVLAFCFLQSGKNRRNGLRIKARHCVRNQGSAAARPRRGFFDALKMEKQDSWIE